MSRYHKFLLLAVLVVWVLTAINPKFPEDWLLENYLVFFFVPLIIILGRWYRLSNVSYTLIAIFTILHLIGAHYTYAEVPFGYTLQDWLGASRNMYDRLVHFSFGFLLAYPIREVFMRLARVKGLWAFYLPLDVTMSFSAFYELIEWVAASTANSAAGIAFLGAQGDIWDAQKDMLSAGIGAVLAMLIVAAIHWKYNEEFSSEFKESFKIHKMDEPLDEVKLRKLIAKKTRLTKQK